MSCWPTPWKATAPTHGRERRQPAGFALHQCLTRLEAKQREVVSLAYLRDQSHGELAEQLQLPWAPSRPGYGAGWSSCANAWPGTHEGPAP